MGLNLRSAISSDVLVEVNHFTFANADDGFLVLVGASLDHSGLGEPLTSLAVNPNRTNRGYGHAVLCLDGLLDFNFIRSEGYYETIRIVALLVRSHFLGNEGFDQNLLHGLLI